MALRRLRGLSVQLVLWTVLPLTVILAAIGLGSVYAHQRSMRALVEERNAGLVKVAADRLSGELAHRLAVLQALADQAGGETSSQELLERSSNLLTGFEGGVAVFDAEGKAVAAYPSAMAWRSTSTVGSLLEQASSSRGPVFSPPFPDPITGEEVVLAAVHLTGGELTVVGAFALESLGLRDLNAGRRAMVFLVDEGRIIYHPDRAQLGQDLANYAGLIEVQKGVAGATYHRDPSGEEWAVGYAPVSPTGWELIIQEPWMDVIVPAMRYSLFAPLIVLGAAVISLVALYFGVRRVIRPLQALDQAAGRVAWGDFNAARLPVGGVQEIEDLRHTLEQMAEQIRRYQAGMQSYVAAITQGQEEERKRLARELHDDTAQSLAGLIQRIKLCQRDLTRNPERIAARLAELEELATMAWQNVRRFSEDLRPSYLEQLGLVPALETLVEQTNGVEGLQVGLQVRGRPQRLSSGLELALFRIVQEALNNVRQHAQARHVAVHLEFGPEGVTATVEDDGVGFDVPELPHELAGQGHFGLMGMRERVLLFGGQLSIHSEPGRGTRVIAYLPTAASGGPATGEGAERVGSNQRT